MIFHLKQATRGYSTTIQKLFDSGLIAFHVDKKGFIMSTVTWAETLAHVLEHILLGK